MITTVNAGIAWVMDGTTCTILYTYVGDSAPGLPPYDEFLGASVHGVGDVDLDGHDDFIIGSPGYYGGVAKQGRAVVYSGATGNAIHDKTGGEVGAYFGFAVGNGGDFNNDGVPDFVVGATYQYSATSPIDGKAIVYSGLDGLEPRTIIGTTNNAYMGWSVSTAGDYDNDGIDDVVVGETAAGGRSALLFGAGKIPNPYLLTHVNAEWPGSSPGLLSNDVPAIWVQGNSPPTPGSVISVVVHGSAEHASLNGRIESRINSGSWTTWVNNVNLNSQGFSLVNAQISGSSTGDVWDLRWRRTSGSEFSNEVRFTLN